MGHFQEYEHTQPGTLVRVSMVITLLVLAGVGTLTLLEGAALAAIYFGVLAAVFVFILMLFQSLTVRVSRDEVALWFGIGLIRKRFETKDIQTAAAVQNRWFNGWGVRKIMGGWLYNVSGWDAVEIELADGRRYRIGTDEPQALLAAIQAAIG
jgi:hypothetical protein